MTEPSSSESSPVTSWEARRSRAALRLGYVSEQAASRLQDLIPDAGKGVDPAALRELKEIMLGAAEAAELLIGNPTRHTMRSVPSDQFIAARPESADEERAAVLRLVDGLSKAE